MSLDPDRGSKKTKQSAKSKVRRWAVFSTLFTFFLSFTVNFLSKVAVADAPIAIAIVILLIITLIGVLFDLVGTAVTAADEAPFHSMSAQKVRGAAKSINLIRNAERVSNFCNDIIGDICGVVSGSTAAVVVLALSANSETVEFWMSMLFTAMIAALTVGGKAFGKGIALAHCNDIIFFVGKVLSVFDGGSKDGKKKVSASKK